MTPTSMTVSGMSPREALARQDDLLSLYARAFAGPPRNETAETVRDVAATRLREQLAQPGLEIVVAELDGALVGATYGWPAPEQLPDQPLYRRLVAAAGEQAARDHLRGGPLEVVELMVAPDAQGQGLGRRLLEELRNGRRAWLLTDPAAPAARFYEGAGWRVLARTTAGNGTALSLYVHHGDATPARPAQSLSSHEPQHRAPADRLRDMLETVSDDELPDEYGQGGRVEVLESRVADLLGKPAAVLMPTGSMASQVALRLHADARATRTVGFHPRAHVEVHEHKGYAVVHQLVGLLLGDHDRLLALSDLQVSEPLAAVLWELPQRDLGGLLPDWDDLVAQTTWVADHGAARHLDGARLWEAQPFYGRSHAEIAALFDTVYVSLYKSLGGLGGAVLAGPAHLVAQARDWRARLGGQIYHAWPLAVTAEQGLDRWLPRMPAYWERAREIGVALAGIDGVEVVPSVPQTPLFHVLVRAPQAALDHAHAAYVKQGGMQLFRYSRSTSTPSWSRFEVTIGEHAMAIDVSDMRAAMQTVAEQAAVADAGRIDTLGGSVDGRGG